MSISSQNPLHVIVATPLGSAGKGGIDRIMDNLAEGVRSHDNNVYLKVLKTRGEGPAIFMLYWTIRFIFQILWARAFKRADVVHLNVAQRGSVLRKATIAVFCNLFQIPYVLHVHGSQFHLAAIEGTTIQRYVLSRLINRASRIIVLGSYWYDVLISMGAKDAQLRILPNATRHPPVANNQVSVGPCRILFLGQLGPRKGVPELVKALATLKNHGAWRATLAGNGEVENTRAQIAHAGIGENIDVKGWANSDEVKDLLETHQILVLPSYNENLPMSVIEGMSYGLAIIATPVGAVPDILQNEKSGLLVPPGDVAALSHALQRCIDDTGLRRDLGNAARNYHAEFLNLNSYPFRMSEIWRSTLDSSACSVVNL